MFEIRPTREADLARQRLRFAPRLLSSAGVSGWCVLLDEVELIGRYSPLQRGKSYAELSRWLGRNVADALPGIVAVAALTDDYVSEMFDSRRDDELIPQALERKGLTREAEQARTCMAHMRRAPGIRLAAPDDFDLCAAQGRIAELYFDAYRRGPESLAIGERLAGKSMRQYIKSWITQWDMERLFGERAKIAIKPNPDRLQ